MKRNDDDPYSEDEIDDLDDDEISKAVEADFRAMIEDAMAEANALLSEDSSELAYVKANYTQLLKGQALQKAAQRAFQAGDFTLAQELDQQKTAELAQILERAGNHGSLVSRATSWFLRRKLRR
ncbi:MAG: hypothetical protein AAFS07_00670 [Pseudomonadota bacterium]